MKKYLLCFVVLALLLSGCGGNIDTEAKTDEKSSSDTYCNTSTATWQQIEVPDCEGAGLICAFSSFVVKHPPDCDLPNLYCIIGVGQEGLSCTVIP